MRQTDWQGPDVEVDYALLAANLIAMATVFISYHRQSEKIARDLAEDIEALGYRVWFDQELTGGQTWWDQILATVRDCDVFIFVLEPEALKSTACKREYGYAADLGKPILPVLVADGVQTNLLPPALSQIQFVDYRKQDRSAALRLAKSLNMVPPAPPLPDPAPAPPEAPISYLGTLIARIEAVSLSYEEQSALVFDLKRGYRDQATRTDALTLLGQLRRRRDLFANVAEEIDEVMAQNAKRAEPVHQNVSETQPARNDIKPARVGSTTESTAPSEAAPAGATIDSSAKPLRHQRLMSTLMLGVVGGVFGAVLIQEYFRVSLAYIAAGSGLTIQWALLIGAGALAGLISWKNLKAKVAAVVFMILPILLAAFGMRDIHPFTVVPLAPVAALIVVLISKSPGK